VFGDSAETILDSDYSLSVAVNGTDVDLGELAADDMVLQ